MNILTAAQTWPFGAALVVMLGLAVLEAAGLRTPRETGSTTPAAAPDPLAANPVSITGYLVQSLALHWSGALLAPALASVPAALAGMAAWGFGGAVVGRLLPGDQTRAVSELSLIGRAGVVLRGIAVQGHAAEAKVYDSHGYAHYVMVEPDIAGESLAEGCEVLLVSKVGARFHCIVNPYAAPATRQ